MNDALRLVAINGITTLIDRHSHTLLVAQRGNDILGTVSLNHKGKRAAEVWKLYVRPDWRRIGIGRRLIRRCCAIAADNGCESIGLSVDGKNSAAVALYVKLGFVLACEYEGSDTLYYCKQLGRDGK